MKRILVTGNGKSGSYRIRAEQLGTAIGAIVIPKAIPSHRYDVGVIVKRLDPRSVAAMRITGTPIVYDIVDAWPQPYGNLWDRGECMTWLRSQLRTLRPQAVVAATQAMAHDVLETGFKGPVLTLPHHARPGLTVNPIRQHVQTVGYEGGVQYLGKWQPIIEAECKARGWRFVLNPAQLAELDIVLALREADGYAARNWKSNVKLANAQGSGTPFVGCPEAGYIETGHGAPLWANSRADLASAFNQLTSEAIRSVLSEDLQDTQIRLPAVAKTYRDWLEAL